jgi:hypothetical protein
MKILLILAVGITALLLSCKSPKTTQPDSIAIVVDPSVSFQFGRFLNAISLLIGDEKNSVVNVKLTGDANLTFRSIGDFPGDPVFIHVLPDRVAWGTGASRQLMSVEDLRKNLQIFAEAAASSGTEGFISMASEDNVTGQFGLKVLNAVSDAGIPNVMLITPDLLEASRPRVTKKPSPPSPNNKKQNKAEMATPGKPSD